MLKRNPRHACARAPRLKALPRAPLLCPRVQGPACGDSKFAISAVPNDDRKLDAGHEATAAGRRGCSCGCTGSAAASGTAPGGPPWRRGPGCLPLLPSLAAFVTAADEAVPKLQDNKQPGVSMTELCLQVSAVRIAVGQPQSEGRHSLLR